MARIKLKSHSGARKRLSRTGTGKLRHHKGGRRHLLTGKGANRKRRLGRAEDLSKTTEQSVNRMLPYN